jgi:fructose-1,6-bisphosphatase
MNGEVIETKNSKVELFNTGDKGSIQYRMNELIMELTNKRNSYSVNKKHKIICIGDSHIRRFTNVVKKPP